jgi:hypothetical protein
MNSFIQLLPSKPTDLLLNNTMPANDDVRVICGYRLGNGNGRQCDARVSWEASDVGGGVRIECCKRHLHGVLSDNPTLMKIACIKRNGTVVRYAQWWIAPIGDRVHALMATRYPRPRFRIRTPQLFHAPPRPAAPIGLGLPTVVVRTPPPPPPASPPCAKMNELPQECAGDDCAICFTQMFANDAGELTACRHQFHTACVNRWLGTNKTTCPMCRVAIQRS